MRITKFTHSCVRFSSGSGDVDVAALLDVMRPLMLLSVAEGGMVTTGDRRAGRTHWVYARAGRPCWRCGTAVRLSHATGAPYARETWWCPTCQPGPVPAADAPAGPHPRTVPRAASC